MLGPRAGAFDDDDIPNDIDDEDLKNDPISQMDMTVRAFIPMFPFNCRVFTTCAATLRTRGTRHQSQNVRYCLIGCLLISLL